MAKWEVGPTKDVIEAFMEFLVDPRLPRRVSNDIDVPAPSEDAQKSVARQMHAVVLLYNYYHRRQKPELEFLDFVSFCKLAVELRPQMIGFMKFMNKSEPMELNDVEGQLSVTQKAIKNACSIASALDASVDVPNTEGWPISRIAVILLDKSNENYWLQDGAITEGVWSTFEKYTNESLKVLAKNNVGTGNKRKENADSEFLQLAFDVVKKHTGIHHSDLVVVGTDVTYSLSKEKSATQVYLIRCPQTFSPRVGVPIKVIVESLQGPLANQDFGSWTSTDFVLFHHMLPYMGFISRWLSGEALHLPSLSDWNAWMANNSRERDLAQSGILTARNAVKTEYCEEIVNHNTDHSRKRRKQSSRGEAKTAAEDVRCPANCWEFTDTLAPATKESSIINLSDSDEYTDGLRSFYQSLKDNSIVGSAKKKQKNKLDTLGTESEGTGKKRHSKTHKRKNVSSARHEEHGRNEIAKLDNGDFLICYDQNEADVTERSLVPFKDVAKNNIGEQSAPPPSSGEVERALALVEGQRHGLLTQIYSLEDKVAVYEDNMQRIKEGDVGVARACIKRILSENTEPDEGHSKSGPYLLGQSSCQDLEFMCQKNNWRLPRYFVEVPSNGKFLSNLFVGSKDFQLSTKGGLESDPGEAMESAAAQMIAKVHDHFTKVARR